MLKNTIITQFVYKILYNSVGDYLIDNHYELFDDKQSSHVSKTAYTLSVYRTYY